MVLEEEHILKGDKPEKQKRKKEKEKQRIKKEKEKSFVRNEKPTRRKSRDNRIKY